ncbi:MAG: RNA polymerase sigma factor [Candidatus Hydrogenedentota bacterium]|nr:MAG: RNA polymerase sigma factor [Candidatus Hydrogenedentota bacterium]
MSYPIQKYNPEENLTYFLEACKRKDQDALALLYSEFIRLINGAVRKVIMEDDVIIDEISHDVFVMLLENNCELLTRFEGDSYGKFRAYVARIARFTALNASRKRYRRLSSEESLEEMREQGWEAIAPDYQKNDHVYKMLETAIYELPLKYREPILLRLEGYKTKEIAEILNANPNTILSRIDKAKRILKEKLDELVS